MLGCVYAGMPRGVETGRGRAPFPMISTPEPDALVPVEFIDPESLF